MGEVDERNQGEYPHRYDQNHKRHHQSTPQISRLGEGDELARVPELISQFLHSYIAQLARVKPHIVATPKHVVQMVAAWAGQSKPLGFSALREFANRVRPALDVFRKVDQWSHSPRRCIGFKRLSRLLIKLASGLLEQLRQLVEFVSSRIGQASI